VVTRRNPAVKTETINLKNGTEVNCLSLVSCGLALLIAITSSWQRTTSLESRLGLLLCAPRSSMIHHWSHLDPKCLGLISLISLFSYWLFYDINVLFFRVCILG